MCARERRRTGRARELLQALQAAAERRYVDATTIATIHAALGELDAAFAGLEQALRDQSARLTFMQILPEFAPLRADPRYADIVRRLGVS